MFPLFFRGVGRITTLELNLPDRLAREAQAAGLLTPEALAQPLKDAMRRRAGQALLAGAARATQPGSKPMSISGKEIFMVLIGQD